MRTTLNVHDDALALAQAYAKARGLKLGDAVSELILSGQRQRAAAPAIEQKDGVWVFALGKDAPRITSEQVKEFLEEQG
jgi:hypothetical protein